VGTSAFLCDKWRRVGQSVSNALGTKLPLKPDYVLELVEIGQKMYNRALNHALDVPTAVGGNLK
jgi:hypothetical protein